MCASRDPAGAPARPGIGGQRYNFVTAVISKPEI